MTRGCVALILCALVSGCVTTETSGVQKAPTAQRLQAQLDLARGYLELGDVAGARRPLERALKIDPRSAEAHVLMATVYLTDGDKRLAEQEYRTALRDDPRNAMAHNNYGTFLFAEERYKDAKAQLQQAADDPKYARRAQAFENLGLTELKLGETDAAKQSFRRALMLNSALPRCYLELAQIDLAAGDFPAAKDNFDRYNAIAKPTPRSLWLGIRLSRVLNDKDQLASYAIALRNLFPDSEEYRLYQDRQW
jgi:type IV pilus assembly protein PilF